MIGLHQNVALKCSARTLAGHHMVHALAIAGCHGVQSFVRADALH